MKKVNSENQKELEILNSSTCQYLHKYIYFSSFVLFHDSIQVLLNKLV